MGAHQSDVAAVKRAGGDQLSESRHELALAPPQRAGGLSEPAADAASARLPSSLYAAARLYAGEQLQRLLVATIDLGLTVNQAHWNVHGRGSQALQLLLDDLSGALARQRHLLARRATELGVAPDGRAYTVATESRLVQLADGPLAATDAAAAVADQLDSVAELVDEQLTEPGATDAETRQVLSGFSELLERHRAALLQRTGIRG